MNKGGAGGELGVVSELGEVRSRGMVLGEGGEGGGKGRGVRSSGGAVMSAQGGTKLIVEVGKVDGLKGKGVLGWTYVRV